MTAARAAVNGVALAAVHAQAPAAPKLELVSVPSSQAPSVIDELQTAPPLDRRAPLDSYAARRLLDQVRATMRRDRRLS